MNVCFKYFFEAELLIEENKWYYNKCKKHQKAKKQIKLYRMPKYLIIYLKKFEDKINFFNYVKEKRQEDFIKYPLKNLYLNHSNENEEERKYTNDLYVVNQHHGTINEENYILFIN